MNNEVIRSEIADLLLPAYRQAVADCSSYDDPDMILMYLTHRNLSRGLCHALRCARDRNVINIRKHSISDNEIEAALYRYVHKPPSQISGYLCPVPRNFKTKAAIIRCLRFRIMCMQKWQQDLRSGSEDYPDTY